MMMPAIILEIDGGTTCPWVSLKKSGCLVGGVSLQDQLGRVDGTGMTK
jgi:hypothetical protein